MKSQGQKIGALGTLAAAVIAGIQLFGAAQAEPRDSFAHGGGFHHRGTWDGGFGPGFIGAFDDGMGIRKPYQYGGQYGYRDDTPYGYERGYCYTDAGLGAKPPSGARLAPEVCY